MLVQFDHARAPSNREGKPGSERIDDCGNSAFEADEEAPARATRASSFTGTTARGGSQTADQASLAPFHFDETRHRRRDAERFRVGGIDPTGQRLRDPIEHFAAETARNEPGEAFVAIGAPARNEWLEHDPQFAAHRKQRAFEHRPDEGGREQRKSLGDFEELPSADDVGFPELLLRGDHFGGQPEAFSQLERPRFLGEKRIGASLDRESVAPDRFERTAEAITGLEQQDLDWHLALGGEFVQTVRGTEPCDAATDNGDAASADLWMPCDQSLVAQAPTIEAIISINFGWSPTVPARIILTPDSRAILAASTSRS